jgi:hypothetical protein
VTVSLPNEISERLPDEAEVEFTVREEDAVIEMKLIEVVTKPVALSARRQPSANLDLLVSARSALAAEFSAEVAAN